jgi:hypothetical protein
LARVIWAPAARDDILEIRFSLIEARFVESYRLFAARSGIPNP